MERPEDELIKARPGSGVNFYSVAGSARHFFRRRTFRDVLICVVGTQIDLWGCRNVDMGVALAPSFFFVWGAGVGISVQVTRLRPQLPGWGLIFVGV